VRDRTRGERDGEGKERREVKVWLRKRGKRVRSKRG